MRRFLPYGRQTIEDDDIAAVAAALRADFLTTGPLVEAFEAAFAAGGRRRPRRGLHQRHRGPAPGRAGARTSGRARPRSCRAITFLATANARAHAGAEVVFADVDPDTGLMTPGHAGRGAGRAPRRRHAPWCLPVHLNGQVCDMAGLGAVAAGAGCAGRGRLPRARRGGVPAPAATAGRPPSPSTRSRPSPPARAASPPPPIPRSPSACALRSHGMVREPASFARPDLAFDGRAAIPGTTRCRSSASTTACPTSSARWACRQLAKLRPLARPPRASSPALYDAPAGAARPRHRAWCRAATRPDGCTFYVVLIDFAALGTDPRAGDGGAARARRRHPGPLHPGARQPYYRDRYGPRRLPGADAYYARCLSLPVLPAMTDDDVARVVAALKRSVGA